MATTSHGEQISKADGQCMKCKKQVNFQVDKINTWKNGMEAAVGKCGKCGTTINRILGKVKVK